MEDNRDRWLPHLEGAVPTAAQGKRISTYTLALEGWRRGITLNFYSQYDKKNRQKIRYSLSYKGKKHHFSLSKGDKVTDEAFRICDNKDLTKKYLAKAGVPVPEGKRFKANIDDEEILNYAKALGYPLVLKPISGNGGKGVFANIKSEDILKDALPYVRQELKCPDVIIEQYIPFEKEFRIIVLEDRVLGAMNRIPANIIGDGVHSIRQLIQLKNEQRRKNPHLTNRLIKIDMEVQNLIKAAGYTLDSVLAEGEQLFLRVQSNLSNGGDSVDVTDRLTPELEEIAIRATKAIPGLAHSGVDMMVDEKNNTGVVIEVNSRPGLGGHLFPVKGQARDLAREFIDYYFPETKNMERTNLYFDFDSILEALTSRSASSVEVTRPPLGKLYGKKYIVSGKVQKVGYRKWIRREALKRNLHGYTENLEDGDVVVVVTSTSPDDVREFKSVCLQGPSKAEVKEVEVYDWNAPVKIGFEIKRREPKQVQKLLEWKERIERDNIRITKKYTRILNSRTWRYTSFIRKFVDWVKVTLGLKKEVKL